MIIAWYTIKTHCEVVDSVPFSALKMKSSVRHTMLNADCLHNILRFVDNGADYKNLLLVCRLFRDFFAPNHIKYVRKFSNHLLTLLKMAPDKNWEWWFISGNPNLTWEYIRDNSRKLHWSPISRNECITWDIIRNNPDGNWVWSDVSTNPNITIDILENNPDYPWNWTSLSSSNPNIDWNTAKEHPYHPWKWDELSFSATDISWEHLMVLLDWDGWCRSGHLSVHPCVTWDIIQNNPGIRWCSRLTTRNRNMTWDIILNNLDYQWDWKYLSGRSDTTWDFVKNNLNLPWEWARLTNNPNITLDIIQNNPDYPWKWNIISSRRDVTWEFIMDHPEIQWDWRSVSANPNITWDIILGNPDYPWNWTAISCNRFSKDEGPNHVLIKFYFCPVKLNIESYVYMFDADCFCYMIQFLNNGRDYKNLLLVCRQFRDLCAPNHMMYVRKFSNHLPTPTRHVSG